MLRSWQANPPVLFRLIRLYSLQNFLPVIYLLQNCLQEANPKLAQGEEAMVDYHPIRSTNHTQPAAEPEQEEKQAVPEPIVDVVWNVYTEKGDAKSMALKVSIRLPLQS